MNLRELHEYISTFDFRQYGIEQIDFVEIRSKDGKVVYHINTQGYEISKIVKSLLVLIFVVSLHANYIVQQLASDY